MNAKEIMFIEQAENFEQREGDHIVEFITPENEYRSRRFRSLNAARKFSAKCEASCVYVVHSRNNGELYRMMAS